MPAPEMRPVLGPTLRTPTAEERSKVEAAAALLKLSTEETSKPEPVQPSSPSVT